MLRNRSVRSQQDRMATLKRGSVRGFGTLMNQQGNSPYGNTLHADGRTSPSPSFATSMGDVRTTVEVILVCILNKSRIRVTTVLARRS